MKCIVCGKMILTKKEVCNECDGVLDIIHNKDKDGKEKTLRTFREVAKNEKRD